MPPKKVEFDFTPRKDFSFDGNVILASMDSAAEYYGPETQAAVLELEMQVRRSDGTWVRVDPERVRMAPRGQKT